MPCSKVHTTLHTTASPPGDVPFHSPHKIIYGPPPPSLVCRFKPPSPPPMSEYVQPQPQTAIRLLRRTTLAGGGVRDVPAGGERADARQARVYLAGGGGKLPVPLRVS